MKASGSYSEPDVVRQLKEDAHDKCYICELKNLSDPEVEHLKPHYKRTIKERVFDWNNLFYVCPHCNSIKNATIYNEKIIDCCAIDPEAVLEQVYVDGHVMVRAHGVTEDDHIIMTADLIQNCFEKRNTEIREIACQHRIDGLAKDMNVLYKTLMKYKTNPDSVRYKKSLKAMLARESQYASFKRQYVRSHLSDYPALQEYIS